MKLKEIIEKLGLDVKVNTGNMDTEVTRGYSSDLLSDVMANAQDGDIWITMQTHQNIVAVAVLKSISCIILVNNREPEEATIEKAKDEDVLIATTSMSTFNIIGKLFEFGITGS